MPNKDSPRPLIRESSTSESTNVEVVLKDLNEGTVLIPDYQRDSDQWSHATKSLLIESVINNLPIPAFFFEVSVDEDGLEVNNVVDGQQRITTINEFFQHKLRLIDSLSAPYLSPNSIHYAGKTFDELPQAYQQAFKRYRLSIIKLRDLEGMKLEVFRRINIGGTPLSGQDIRLAYYGDRSRTLAFIRLVGIYDKERQATRRFIENAKKNFNIEFPWQDASIYADWKDMWDQKAISRGQTASEMFLWALIASQYSQIDNILKNPDALSALNVRFNKAIDEVLDVYCAQLQYQDRNPNSPAAILEFDEIENSFFPYFCLWIKKLGIYGANLSVTKHRTIASIIGAAYRQGIKLDGISKEQWGEIVQFIRTPAKSVDILGIEWPRSRGRWDGEKGHRFQLETAAEIVKRYSP